MRLRIFLLIALMLGAVAAPPHEAIITAVKGGVTLKGQPVKLATRLNKGDKLEVAQGASVTVVYLTDSHKESVTGPGSLTVGGDSTGKVEKRSGPGALAIDTSINSKGAVSSKRARSPHRADVGYEGARLDANGNAELIFWTTPDYDFAGTIDVQVLPADGDTPVAKAKDEPGTIEHTQSVPYHGKEMQHRVVKLKTQLKEGVPYRLKWADADDVNQSEFERWIIVLSPERSNSLVEMQRWAYESATPDKLLSLVQIACEWQDYGVALDAAEKAYDLKNDAQTREVYRKLLILNREDKVAENL